MITINQYATALYQTTADQPQSSLTDLIKNFLKLLSVNNDLHRIDGILSAFEQIWQEENNIITAELTTKEIVNKTVLKNITNYLKKTTNSEKVEWKEVIDPELLGGLIIKYKDQVIDGSLKTNLQTLKHKIAN